jgi:molybdate transport system substrate-binding protein
MRKVGGFRAIARLMFVVLAFIRLALLVLALLVLALFAPFEFGSVGVADASDIRVFSTGAPAEAAKALAASFAKATGNHVIFTVGQPATIEGDLAAGDGADVVILPAAEIAKLVDTGELRPDSAVDIARVGIGVVVRSGAIKPDISSAAAIRKLLLDAHSIVYPGPQGGGTAGLAVTRMVEQMGLTETIRPKLVLTSAIGGGVALVAAGKAEVGFFNISEIMPVRGVTLVGPLPPELQNYIVFDAAIPKSNRVPEPALACIHALVTPAAAEVWRKSGMEPIAATR